MSRPFKLYRLQQLDSQLDWIQNRLAEIEKLLAEDAAFQLAWAHAAEMTAAHQAAEKDLRHTEDEVKAQRIKIEQNESSLYGGKIRNPKELKDLENEVAALKRYLGVLEDRQLEAMLHEEDSLVRRQDAERLLEEARIEQAKRAGGFIQERDKISNDRARLEEERSASAAAIPAEDLAIYTQIRKNRRGVAVAKVTERACSACGSTLNSSLLNAIRSPDEIHRCDVCGRILYIG
jgi:predicted  nucleic acid-binding Zn-ribbon protein